MESLALQPALLRKERDSKDSVASEIRWTWCGGCGWQHNGNCPHYDQARNEHLVVRPVRIARTPVLHVRVAGNPFTILCLLQVIQKTIE